jgi:hypothetical protein
MIAPDDGRTGIEKILKHMLNQDDPDRNLGPNQSHPENEV